MGLGRKSPEIVLRNGKPAAVIVDLAVYEELLERVEDFADLKRLQSARKKSLHFQRLDDFLKTKDRRVRRSS
jgi:PHD/YefM family antitoxin component YafN of YafNO toxin-antitoxin module